MVAHYLKGEYLDVWTIMGTCRDEIHHRNIGFLVVEDYGLSDTRGTEVPDTPEIGESPSKHEIAFVLFCTERCVIGRLLRTIDDCCHTQLVLTFQQN